MDIDQQIATLRAGRAARIGGATAIQTASVPLARKLRVEQVQTQVAAAPASSTEKVFDIANNTVARIMERGDLSDKGKLEAVVQFLNAADVELHCRTEELRRI